MDVLTKLIQDVGLWPALVIVIGWAYDRLMRELLREYRERIKTLEAEARATIAEKNAEIGLLRDRAFGAGRERR